MPKLLKAPLYLRVRRAHRPRRRWPFLILILAFILAAVPCVLYFRELSGVMAASDAGDLITAAVNEIVLQTMSDPTLDYDYFVDFERDNDGRVAAIITNMARVNTLSARLLNAVVEASNLGELNLEIPLGNLLGAGVLLGRGPDVPVRVTMLTSSRAGFHNELVSAGINQTKHQVMLELFVDVDVLLPVSASST